MTTRLRRLAPLLLAAAVFSLSSAARADGTGLYVTLANGTVEGFNTTTDTGVTEVTGLTGPVVGIAFDASNDLFVGADNGYEIDEIAAGTGAKTVVTTNTVRARQLAFNASGVLYTTDESGIEKVNAGGMLTALGGFSDGNGLAFDAAGNLYGSFTGNNTIYRFPPGGGSGTAFATGLNEPGGLAFDAAGNLYVANAGANTIMRFSATGAGSVFASTGLSTPEGLAFDAAGNLYVSSLGTSANSGTIERFNAVGGNATLIASGLNEPFFLAFGPAVVPEPASYAALACGAAALLAARRAGGLNCRTGRFA